MHRMLWIPLLMLAAGCGSPSFLLTPVANTNELNEQQLQPGRGFSPGKILIIPIEGTLSNSRSEGLLQPTENPMSLFAQQLAKAELDSSIRAIVLRVNSPGGTVTASDAMYELIKRYKARTKVPIVASVQEVGASGAYYVSCAADRIVAQPTSLVGSIGVIFESIQFEGTLQKLGITTESVKTGSLKDMGSPFRALKPNERAVIKAMVEEDFKRFVRIVNDNRPLKEKPVADLTEYEKEEYGGTYSGRVFSGDKSLELGLIDQVGLLQDAIDTAKKLADAQSAQVVMYIRPYGYGGSIYASNNIPAPRADAMKLQLPGSDSNEFLPAGIYYLWRPGF
jgi:protease-4